MNFADPHPLIRRPAPFRGLLKREDRAQGVLPPGDVDAIAVEHLARGLRVRLGEVPMLVPSFF